MARRHIRHGGNDRPRRRWRVKALLAVVAMGAAVWAAPAVIVQTSLRDRPLAAALAGIDGGITSGGATWRWLGGIEYRDVVLRDRAGRAAVILPYLALDRGLLQLALAPRRLGTVRLTGPEALVEVRSDGSSLEDILAPWLAATRGSSALELEIVNGTIELVDTVRQDAWRLSDVIAAGTLLGDGTVTGWTAAGRVRHSDGPRAAGPSALPVALPTAPVRLDRSTIPAAAAAVLVRDGGWSVSSPEAAADGSRTITAAAHRLPLGASSVLATRFGLTHLVDGVADLRMDVTADPAGRRMQGDATLEQFAVCDARGLQERFTIDRCRVPFDVTLEPDRLVVRRFGLSSSVFQAEASGGLRLPQDDVRRWAEEIVSDDFTVSLDVDLAAASKSLPGGIAVRPDVHVTGGSLRFAAAARADGGDRVLEVRASARDLAAVQQAQAPSDDAPPADEPRSADPRQLAWPEPFTAWLKARRGPGRDERLRVEEARVVSDAVELSAAGTPAAFGIQWTADIGGLVGELGQVLDLAATSARGTCRGRLEVAGADPLAGGRSVALSASIMELELTRAGRPPWRDKELIIEAEATGSMASGVAAVEQARGVITAGDDRLEASVAGGAVVDLAALVGLTAMPGVPWIRPTATATAVIAECAISGDLARWHPRLAAVVPALADGGLELAGTITAAAAVAPKGDAWQWQRAGGEIEKFVARWEGREIVEPRVVVTTAGRADATTGQIDISSGEILSTSLSLRTGGLTWLPATPMAGVGDRLRGRVQWQADVGRMEPWLVSAATAAGWPASGRAWGTLEVIDTQAGLNVLVEATGSQLALAAAAAGAAARPIWGEPRLVVAVEVTRPRSAHGGLANQLLVDRLAVESSTLALGATGRVDDWDTRRIVELDGTLAYDWQQVSRLLSPWTGGRIQLAGSGGRPFSLRGPLGAMPDPADPAASAATAAATSLPLPDDWLAATRGREAEPALAAQLTRPASASPSTFDARLRSLTVDTSAVWTSGEIEGFPLSAGEMTVRLLEGQLAFGPFDLPASSGRIRGAPWIRLAPWPGELVVPPGRFAERIALSGPLCQRIVTWLSPVLGHGAHASGVVTLDLAGARLPLGDAFGGDLAGQATFENLEVSPAPAVQPLVNLLVKLQSAVDPRFVFGDKAVLLRIRPEPVRIRLAGRRLAHDGLVMDAGQLVVKSQGSVGQDGSLDMQLEVALRGDMIGQTPVLGQLFRTPLVIPLKGTVHKPQFDAAAMDTILGRIVENTAQAVINDGIGRGLEAIFGEPKPPGAAPPGQPPISLPPQPAATR